MYKKGYAKNIFPEALENIEPRVKLNGINVNNLRCAYDTVILASSAKEVQILLGKINNVENIHKTKCMIVSRNIYPNINITIEDNQIQQVIKLLNI